MLHWKDIAIERAEREYTRQQKAERIERERAEEEAAYLADLAETGCTPQEIERRPVQLVKTAQGNLFPKEVA